MPPLKSRKVKKHLPLLNGLPSNKQLPLQGGDLQ